MMLAVDTTHAAAPGDLFSDDDNPERNLWAAVLHQLLKDAALYHRGARVADRYYTYRKAYADVTQCGDMLQTACHWLDVEPEHVTRLFKAKYRGAPVSGVASPERSDSPNCGSRTPMRNCRYTLKDSG